MHGPLPLAPIIDRIAAQVPALAIVDSCADLQTAMSQTPTAMPALFLVRTEKTLGRDDDLYSDGELYQKVSAQIACVLFARHARDARTGSAAKAAADAIQAQVRSALIGWEVPGVQISDLPLVLRASRDESYVAGRIVTQDVFETTYDITAD